jgi:hypothetical protein
MALSLHTSYDLYVTYNAAAARLQVARYSRHPCRANVSVAVATLLRPGTAAGNPIAGLTADQATLFQIRQDAFNVTSFLRSSAFGSSKVNCAHTSALSDPD